MSEDPITMTEEREPTPDADGRDGRGEVKLAAVADLHYGRSAREELQAVLSQASEAADVLLLGGDLTDHGLPAEAQMLAEDLRRHVTTPVVGVLGNHDCESGHAEQVREILCDAGMVMLDGESTEIAGVGFAGVAGFGGGFDQYGLNPFGEPMMKQFVKTTVDEQLKLEHALGRLRTDRVVVLLHYAPVRATVEGEPAEIFPFLGSSRLEDPLNHFQVDVAFHGHAHRGTHAGATATGVPVFNVSLPLLKSTFPDRPPFHIFSVETGEGAPHRARSGERSSTG